MENPMAGQYSLSLSLMSRTHTHTHTHTHTVHVVHTVSMFRYPWFPAVSACWRPRCYWSWLGLTGGDSGLPLTHTPPCFHPSLRSSEAAVSSCRPECLPARVRFLIVRLDGGERGRKKKKKRKERQKWTYNRFSPKSLAGLAWVVSTDVFLAWWLSKHLPSCVHTLPPFSSEKPVAHRLLSSSKSNFSSMWPVLNFCVDGCPPLMNSS